MIKSKQFILDLNLIIINLIFCHAISTHLGYEFLDTLDEHLCSTNLDDLLFIVGDINIDLLSDNKKSLLDFMYGNNLNNFVNEPTRCIKKYKYLNKR